MGRRNLKFVLLATLIASEAAAFPALVLGENDPKTGVVSGKVVVVRQGRRTVLTLAPEVRSVATRLAVLVPVPGPIEEKNANLADPGLVQSLDAWASPRLVVLKDPDPCPMPGQKHSQEPRVVQASAAPRFEEGDYDFETLSGLSVSGVKKHLGTLGFKVPPAGEAGLKPYLNAKQSLLLGVVRLKAAPSPTVRLRPFQIAFESDAFELPLRVGPQVFPEPIDLTIYGVSEKGRIELQSGAAPRAPTGDELPAAVLLDPAKLYSGMLTELAKKRPGTLVLEHAWPGTWCDPCTADALTHRAWKKLGVPWIPANVQPPKQNLRVRQPVVTDKSYEVFVTRLHMMYGAKQQKSDVLLRETKDQNNFQTRFVVREPFQGKLTCASGSAYTKKLVQRREAEAQALSRLTGMDLAVSRREAGTPVPAGKAKTWVDDLWQDD